MKGPLSLFLLAQPAPLPKLGGGEMWKLLKINGAGAADTATPIL